MPRQNEEAELQLASGGAIGQADLEAEEDTAEAARRAAEAALALADDKTAVADAAEGLVEDEVEQKLQTEATITDEDAGQAPAEDVAPSEAAADGAETPKDDATD